MKAFLIPLMVSLSLMAQASDDVTARKNFGTELARCSVYYGAKSGAPGLSKQEQEDLDNKRSTAIRAAARVTDKQFALTRAAEAQARPEAINGAVCDQVMAHPNDRFAYWRAQ